MKLHTARRLSTLLGHVSPEQKQADTRTVRRNKTAAAGVGSKSPDDVVVCTALRTAIGRARKGSFRNTTPDTLLRAVLEATVSKSSVPVEVLGDIVVGNVQLGGSYAGPARMAQFCAGIPETVPLSAVNRQCSSGLQAIANVANSIKAGQIVAGIGAGVESMTHGGGVAKMDGPPPPIDFSAVGDNKLARDAMIPMGITSEIVAERYGITREQQDHLASLSHTKALRAQAEGRFAAEIIPVATTIEDKETGEEKDITVVQDDGPRKGSTTEKLATLRTVFKPDGTTTAGNSSQVSDGAAAVLLMRRSKAEELGMPIIAAYRGFQVVGVMPDEMGIGPAVAIPAVLQECGLSVDDIDVYEINEAFASQATYCIQKLGIPLEKVNPNGGAIALGHPLGMTGARMAATLIHELRRTGKRLGVVSMCIGTGMGAAAVFEAE